MVSSLDASRTEGKWERRKPDLVVPCRVPGLQQLLQGLHLAAVHAAGDVQPALVQRVACSVKHTASTYKLLSPPWLHRGGVNQRA